MPIARFLIAGLLLLAACGGDSDDGASGDDGGPTETTPRTETTARNLTSVALLHAEAVESGFPESDIGTEAEFVTLGEALCANGVGVPANPNPATTSAAVEALLRDTIAGLDVQTSAAYEAKLNNDPFPVMQTLWDLIVYDADTTVWAERDAICGPNAPPLP